MAFVYFLKHKFEVDRRVGDFMSYVERQTGDKVKHLSSDNGGEYGSMALRDFLQQRGIAFEKTVPYAPQQSGVAERTNSVLLDKAHAMMHCMAVPTHFWDDALASAVYTRNVTSSVIDWKMLKTIWTGKATRIDQLRVFGLRSEVYVPGVHRSKFDARSKRCMFLMYTDTWRNSRFYDVKAR